MEEWLEGYATLDLDGMRQHAPAVARALKALHAFELPDDLKERHPKEASLWQTLDEWFAKGFGGLDDLVSRDEGAAKTVASRSDVFVGERVQKAIAAARAKAPPPHANLVFAHNDLLAGNLMAPARVSLEIPSAHAEEQP